VRILGTFAAFSFLSNTWISHPFTISYGQLVAIAATILISGLNYIGVRRAGEFQFLFTLLKVAIILGIVAVGFSYGGGTWANFATEFTGAKGGVAGFFAALVAALWAYDGWNDLNMVAGEIRNPQRNIPLSLILCCRHRRWQPRSVLHPTRWLWCSDARAPAWCRRAWRFRCW
jgi:APA family basic amino acid/polyamine antiporter